MNTTIQNVTLQVLGTGAVADGVVELTRHELLFGLVLVGVGIVLYAVYEYLPSK